jgi:hypothetical protein
VTRKPGRHAAALVPVSLLVAGLVVGCEFGSSRSAPTGTGSAATTGPGDPAGSGPAGVGGPATDPASTSPAPDRTPPAYQSVAPPAERPAALAGTAPGGPGGWVARLWFGGVQVDRDGTRPVVAYAAVELDSDGTRTVAHAKLALFHCERRQAAGSPNFLGCTGRQVEYGDLAAPQLRVGRSGAGGFTVTGSFPTYSYRGVDRSVDLPVRWTGRAFPLQVTCAPDPDPVCRPGRAGRSLASAAVVLGPDALRGRAGLDFGYLNRLTRGAPSSRRGAAAGRWC